MLSRQDNSKGPGQAARKSRLDWLYTGVTDFLKSVPTGKGLMFPIARNEQKITYNHKQQICAQTTWKTSGQKYTKSFLRKVHC